MKFEVLKRSHLKKNIIIGVIVVLILSAIVLTFTKAKYRVTESISLVSGTISFSPYDFNLIAMYLNQEGALPAGQTKVVPKFGFTLNEEQSTCIVDDTSDERITMNYVTQTSEEDAYVDFYKMSQSGTKCTIYFDLIPDSQNPIINGINTRSNNDTSVTIEISASDNIGIYYYYYQLDNEEEIQSEEASYTFDGLTEDSVHTVSVRVVDAAGNEASISKEVTIGLNAGRYILASANAPTGKTTDWTEGETNYYTGNPNNWVSFAGFYWRIIRINGDGTIRMIYQGTSANATGTGTQIGTSYFNSPQDNKTYVGLVYNTSIQHGYGSNSTIMNILNNWYNSNLASYEDKYINTGSGFCSDRDLASGYSWSDSTIYYASTNRTSKSSASLQCNSEDVLSKDNRKLPNPIGLVTSDEYLLADGSNSYLNVGLRYWTMSPHNFSFRMASVFYVDSDGGLGPCLGVSDTYGVRPVINLKSAIAISGSGTTSDPFKVAGA